MASILAPLLVFASVFLPEQPVSELNVRPIGGGGPVAIAAGDANFLVASSWSSHLTPAGSYAMLIDNEGRPLLRTSIPLPRKWSMAAAWSGHEYFIVTAWFDGETLGIRIDGEGNVLDPTPIVVHPGGEFNGAIRRAMAWDGSQFVVLTPLRNELIATRVAESGEILQNDIVVAHPSPWDFSVVSTQGVTLFVFTDVDGTHARTMNSSGVLSAIRAWDPSHRSIAGADGLFEVYSSANGIELQRLNASGNADGAPATVPIQASSFRIVPSGSAYLLAYKDSNGLQSAVRINSHGEFLETPHVVDLQENALIASNKTGAVATWGTAGPGPPSYSEPITLARALDDTGAPQQIHRAVAAQFSPMVTWRGDRPAVAWREVGSTDAPLAIASGPAATLTVSATIDPVFSNALTLYAAVDSGEPAQLETSGFRQQFVRAVWTGRDFIVVWARTSNEILGARIGSDGKISNGPTLIANVTELRDVAIGASSSQVLVVLQDQGIARGILLTPFGAQSTDDLTTLADQQYTAQSTSIASDGENFFVTWIDKSTSANDWIAGRLIDANGHAIKELSGYSTGGDIKSTLTTFWNGTEYVVAWSSNWNLQSTMFQARVARDGKLIDYPPIEIGTIDGLVSSIAAGPAGQLVIAYTRGARAYTRFIVQSRQRSAIHR